MDINQTLLALILLVVIDGARATGANCAHNFTALAKNCMLDVEQEFSLSVSKILAKDVRGTHKLCRKYQEMYYCLHRVLDPCSTLGEHYFGVIQRRMVSHYGQHCPGVSADSRRPNVYHVTPTPQNYPGVSSGEMIRRLKSKGNAPPIRISVITLCVFYISVFIFTFSF